MSDPSEAYTIPYNDKFAINCQPSRSTSKIAIESESKNKEELILYTHHVADRPPAPFSVDAVPQTLAEIQVLGLENEGNEGAATETTIKSLKR